MSAAIGSGTRNIGSAWTAFVALRSLVAPSLPTLVALAALAPLAMLPRLPAQTPVPAAGRDSMREPPIGVLRPGDQLKITVYQNQDLTGSFNIDSRGHVQIPGLGDVPVAGVSWIEAQNRLREQLVRRGFRDPELSVQPFIQVSVLGEVRAPGLFVVEPGTTLLQLLTKAGGPADRADLGRARVVREGREVRIDLKRVMAGSASGRYFLYSNDLLVVPRKGGLTRDNALFAFGAMSVVLSFWSLLENLRR
ncbi:MAG: polysaccharide biosynthesis/export family protein [Gemmatimonadaceae bacterium]